MADPDTPKDDLDPDAVPAEDEAAEGLVEDAEEEGEEPAPAAEPEPEVTPAAAEPEIPAPQPASVQPRRRGGFVPALLGGVIAAGIGFAAAEYVTHPGWPFAPPGPTPEALAQRIDATSTELATVKGGVADLPAKVTALQANTDALSARIDAAAKDTMAQIAALRDDLTARDDTLKQALAALDGRVAAIDKQALAAGVTGGNADAIVLDSLRGQLDDQRKQNETLAAQIADVAAKANARIDAAEKQAAALKADADATAKAALARAALTRVQAALELGGGFAPALADLTAQGAKVPDSLAAVAATGVPTMTDLQEAFPAASRAALAASIKATMGPSLTDRIGAFFRAQTGLRSLTARPGADPDAVLSRAEADVNAGKLTDALTELAALPKDGQAAMANWTAEANTRVSALAAVDGVAQSLGGK
ncbi:MAG: hypothetical protein GC186_01040 [Rhodobacteraceae bacterium]|nr:hypothetical protein [Paracoccaceae bacterium]